MEDFAGLWDVSGDLPDMLDYLSLVHHYPGGRISMRLRRLFAVGCCRLVWDNVTDTCRQAAGVCEQYGEGAVGWEEVYSARAGAAEAYRRTRCPADELGRELLGDSPAESVGVVAAVALGCAAAGTAPPGKTVSDPNAEVAQQRAARKRVRAGQILLARCVFGNPFRPVASDSGWLTTTVVQLARGMYEARDFAAMPILADALQDAGCEQEDVLSHCRDPQGVHVRGCWVVDLVLGLS